ncbi:MAG: hypothetical protein H7Z42_16665, partial [Roseiflexaceae bacterium]|nr:hypothetical protein [Roseiflexaceae bacterium]
MQLTAITFINPAALWLLLLLLPLWLLALAAPSRVGPLRFWASLAVRSLLIVALVGGLAGTQLRQPVDRLATVFLLDWSESIAPTDAARGETFVRDALAAMPADDRAGVVLFGQQPFVERA